jgi:hypothetical protein
MSSAASHPRLRLVGADDEPALHEWARSRRVRQTVIRENRRAAQNPSLEPTDPRWVLAARAYSQLQGSTMTPERRQRVMRTARLLGVRPFDASLIIAIVQDRARRGEGLAEAAPTLTLIQRPRRRSAPSWTALRWIAVIAAALLGNVLLIWWLLGG